MKTMTSRFNPVKNIAVSIGALGLLAPVSVFAGTTTIFAPGVTLESGWYDVNKKSTEQRPQKDFSYCWAATASNLIRWW
ncbi:MAG: IdeS/Mac family cysteine endopeptidase [Opitutales bacterium]|nr:IdeS/Mac family cysteine endopeptidase [Opitutales bacterium]